MNAVLFDLDGVVLHFPASRLASIAAGVGLRPEDFTAAAFDPALLRPLVTGRLSHDAWVARVGAAVGAPEAVARWLDGTFEVDREVVGLMGELRGAGVRVGILTNGTDRTRSFLAGSGVLEAVDAFVCTAELGIAKPDAGAYAAACRALSTEPGATFFTDDTPANVVGARRAGLVAEDFVGWRGCGRSWAKRGGSTEPRARGAVYHRVIVLPLLLACTSPLLPSPRVGEADDFVVVGRHELVVPAPEHGEGPLRVPLVDGRVTPDRQLASMLVRSLYEAFLDRRERPEGAQLVVLVDRQAHGATLRDVLFAAQQGGGASSVDVVLRGDPPPVLASGPAEPPVVGTDVPLGTPEGAYGWVDPSLRKDPARPERIAWVRGTAHRIDERTARVRVQRIADRGRVVFDGAALDGLLRTEGDVYLHASFAAAGDAATYPVLPSLEMLLLMSDLSDRELWQEVERARQDGIVGEGSALEVGPAYARRLARAFEPTQAAGRGRSRRRALMLPRATPPSERVRVAPELRVEPVPEHFERQADRFAQRAKAQPERPELARLAQRYAEAAATARVDLGGEGGPVVPFDWRNDPAARRDVRRVDLVGPADDGVRVRAIVGVQTVDLEASYVRPPTVTGVDDFGGPRLRLLAGRATLLVPVFVEMTVPHALDVQRLRQLGDDHRWWTELRAALSARRGASR